jgi:hypothetical protein
MAEWFQAQQVKGLFPTAQLQTTASTTKATATAPPATAKSFAVSKSNRNGDTTTPPPIFRSASSTLPSPNALSSDGPSSQSPFVEEESTGTGTATKIVLAVCAAIAIPIFGFLIWFVAFRDTWELNNAIPLTSRLDQANQLTKSNIHPCTENDPM